MHSIFACVRVCVSVYVHVCMYTYGGCTCVFLGYTSRNGYLSLASIYGGTLESLEHPTSAFYCCDKTLIKSNLQKKGFIWLTFPGHSPLRREVRQELKAEPGGRECMEVWYGLTSASRLARSAFLYNSGSPIQGWQHP